ncbi:Universal stress protein, UspA [Nitrosococcus oceani ATCC 19707]|uniref:Universal stress protein, UspA n=2 Tax=Nitrosococcus oceani TaxID=1229 RepID=Q3J700_NITOC|nr:universal stress protein [Nitrosococcus oceani]ABA59396.1 Universal stress protein, UspA [Nitrosococcus oceani ATCC 19707]EDZ66107.1 universal stress protein family [Nitrosococcus oceani AFC27]KFI18136.1 universal stress protein [Nitrosococcus oceani C-27]GEM20033.1 universal stress protein [Nitrosococcus oceani]
MNLFKNILYVSEGAVAQDASIMRAVSLAENNQADLTAIDVVPGIGILRSGSISNELQTATVNERRKKLEALIEPYRKRVRIRLDVLEGRTFLEIIRAILRNDHDLLIKPAENPSFIERLFGSDDMQLLRNCPCPVWLTRTEEKSKYEHILAAVDFNPDMPDAIEQNLNQQILDLSSSLAFSDFAALHVVHVWDAPAEAMLRTWADDPQKASIAYVEGVRSSHENAYNRLRRQLIERVGRDASDYLSPEFHMRRGTAATIIPDIAKQLHADLVVMGTVARTGIAGLLIGNTAEAILEQLQCSVLAVKPPGFVSPVKLSK